MSLKGKSHEENLKLVCAVCTNLRGKKATRGVSDSEEQDIKKFAFSAYQKGSIYFPQGLCETCHGHLRKLKNVKTEDQGPKLLLPDNYHLDLPHATRSQSQSYCSCRWCLLARMNGLEFKLWQKEIKKGREGKPDIQMMCQSCGKGLPITQKSHTCSSSDLETVSNMLQSIPNSLKPKITYSLLQELQKEQEGALHLPPASGGKSVVVQVGQQPTTPGMSSLTHKEVVQMATRSHLTGEQQSSLVADLRSKWGRKVVEPGLQKMMPKHNKQFSPFFKVEEIEFKGSDDIIISKHLFFCHDVVGLVDKVKELRGIVEETVNLVQGDTGQGYLKIGINVILKKDLEKEQGVRVPAAGTEFCREECNETGPSSKIRRTREQGVGGGKQFSDWGARKMILLAVVHKIPESHHNLAIIFTSIGLNRIAFKLTGDLAFLMPIIGCGKGCSGTNPCPVCDQRKTTAGGQGSRWVEGEVNLRTLGSLHSNHQSWVAEGERTSAAATMRWKGVCVAPLLDIIDSQGRHFDSCLLDIIVPAPLHLFLGANEIINFMEKTMWPEVKQVLADELGVQYHEYMGKIGNYEGPSLHKMFRNMDKLEPYMLGGSTRRSFYTTLLAFGDVAGAVLGSKQLPVDWREKLHHLKSCILHLHSTFKMSITPKLHILITHVLQWVDRFGRSLGKEGEQQGEAVHHIWKRLLESQGQPKVKESPAYVQFILKCLLMFNANNV